MRVMAQAAHAISRTWRRLIGYCERIYLFIRISTLGFTLLLPLLGSASGQHALTNGTTLLMISVGLAFHIFAYVLNDVVDLRLDRTEPLRADSPLVQGKFTRRQALWLALSQPPLAFAIAYLAGVTLVALYMLGAAFLSLAAYNLYGKRCSLPPLTDFVQAIGWCALVLFGAFAYAPTAHADTTWLITYVFVYVLLINGIHGGVRDLANDLEHQARTTAIWLGARPTHSSGAKLTVWLTAYGFVLQSAMVTFAVMGLDSLNYVQPDYWLAAVPVYAGLTASTLMLLGLLVLLRDRRKLVAMGASHTFVSLAVLPALYLPMLGPTAAATVLAVFCLPAIAMYLYNGSHWCL